MTDGLKLIASILETGSVETLRQTTNDLFMDEEVPVITFVRSHYRRYGQIPSFETVEEQTRRRLPATTEQIQYYLRRVYDRKLFTDISPEFTRLRDSLTGNDMDGVRSQLSRMRSIARDNQPDEDVRDIRQAVRGVMSTYDAVSASSRLSGVPTGFPSLDASTDGYQQGDFVSWVGRASMGKTYILLKQAEFAWQAGYSVLLVTMEMTITQIARRLAAMVSGINPDYIRKGTLSTWAERRLRRTLDNLSHTERFTLYAGGFSKTVEDIELLAQEFNPDIVFIDGVYLLRPSLRRNMSRLERLPEVLDEIKRMTITQNRPIVGTSQFSRKAGSKGKEGTMENIGLSDAFGTHSSLVFAIKQGAPPYQTTRRTIGILKGREGEEGEMHINYQFSPMNFEEVSAEQQHAEGVDLGWMG